MQYPDPGLHHLLDHLLDQTLNKVPSLACLAAVAVRNWNVGYEELPIILQRFVDHINQYHEKLCIRKNHYLKNLHLYLMYKIT
jgi:hypothetical protein